MGDVYIVLQNKMIFKGKGFGAMPATLPAGSEALGELVFTTGMGSCIETLTDPRYYGQLVIQTFPLIGNYGIIKEDTEGKRPVLKAYIVREHCEKPSNFRCDMTLDDYLKKEGVVGVFDIDTRELTKALRENGVMNAKICADISDIDYNEIAGYKIIDAVASVSEKRLHAENLCGKHKVALIDYGMKGNVSEELCLRGCEVTVVPHTYTAEQILALGVQGAVLSDGPGDPAVNSFETGVIKDLLGRLPLFGMGLGHQMLALAAGGETYKLKYGHRGASQPVKCLETGRVYITDQNQGYAVDAKSLKNGRETFVNLNDGANEGMEYPELKAFSVQFNPDLFSGPLDPKWLFDKFIAGILQEG